jgi:broad specificity phosphatase PhoE
LIRHLESVKNVNKTFSSIKDSEPLTKNSYKKGIELGHTIYEIQDITNIPITGIFTAKSERSTSTAKFISDQLGCNYIPMSDLRSIRYASQGISESKASQATPRFIKELELYRCGLFNSYDISTPEGSEELGEFESRISKTLKKVIRHNGDGIKIIIAHRSSITASLVYFAREFHKYPDDFFGFVRLNLGYGSLIKINKNSSSIDIINKPMHFFLNTSHRWL